MVAALLLAALALAFFVRVSAQYLYMALPWIAALATAPIRKRALSWLYLGLLVLPGLVEIGLYFGPRHGDRPRWREAYAHVFEQRAPHDLVYGMAAVVGQYYLDPGASTCASTATWCGSTPTPPTRSGAGRGAAAGPGSSCAARSSATGRPTTARPSRRCSPKSAAARWCCPCATRPATSTVEVYVREPWAAGGSGAP